MIPRLESGCAGQWGAEVGLRYCKCPKSVHFIHLMIRNLILDWSGTLVNDLEAVWLTTNHILKRAGKTPMTLDQFRMEFTLPFSRFYDTYVPEVGIEELERWWHEYFPGVEHLVEPLPGSREFLEYAKLNGLRTYICSAIHHNQFSTQSERSGFMHLIDAPYIEVRDKTERIHRILSENSLERSETLFIGDMEHDIEAAKSGGVYSCAVLTGYNSLAQLRQSKPDLIVENLKELRDILVRNDFEIRIPDKDAGLVSGGFPVATVGALIFNPNGHMLMVRTHKWSDLWGIPGGKIHRGESCEDALKREVYEETALKINRIHFEIIQECVDSEEFYKPAHFLLLNYSAHVKEWESVKLNDEAQEFRWVSPDEALKLALNTPTRILIHHWQRSQTSTPLLKEHEIMDCEQVIELNGIEIDVRLGVPDWERHNPQKVVIDLEFTIDAGKASRTDDLLHTINYAAVVESLRSLLASREWKLLETMIEDIVHMLAREYRMDRGRIRIEKFVMAGQKSVAISRSW